MSRSAWRFKTIWKFGRVRHSEAAAGHRPALQASESAALLLKAADEFFVRNLLGPPAVQVGIALQDFLIGNLHLWRQRFAK